MCIVCRYTDKKSSERSIDICEIDPMDAVNKIGHFVAVWESLSEYEMALHPQLLKYFFGQQRKGSAEMV